MTTPIVRRPWELDPTTIGVHAGHQHRVGGLDPERVKELAAVLADGGRFDDPLPVYQTAAGEHFLDGDGHHRLAAAVLAKVPRVPCLLRQGQATERDAWLLSLKANASHGAKRTPEDIRNAVAAALADPELSQLADRPLGVVLRLDGSTIGKYRRAITGQAADPVKSAAAKAGNAKRHGTAALPADVAAADDMLGKIRTLLRGAGWGNPRWVRDERHALAGRLHAVAEEVSRLADQLLEAGDAPSAPQQPGGPTT